MLILLALCCSAWYWQAEWTRGVREERESLRGTPTTLREREESWSTIVIGRPSGADSIELEQLPVEPGTEPEEGHVELPFLFGGEVHAAEGGSGAQPTPPPEPAADFEYVVPKGRVLSKICEGFYGSGRTPIPERVASYNGLASPDALRAGVLLYLPPWEVLFPDGREHP